MQKRSRILAFIIAGTALCAGLAVLFGPSLSNSIAASRTQKAAAHAAASNPVMLTGKIVPADVMGPTSIWSPLTGDGN
jgi:hypothetical protein